MDYKERYYIQGRQADRKCIRLESIQPSSSVTLLANNVITAHERPKSLIAAGHFLFVRKDSDDPISILNG